MRIVNSECFKYMEQMESNSIDTIITDPPYGLKFMGKRWDYDVPNSTVWRGCLNVLKPGGTMLVFAGSRTQHRMAVAIEDAGFVLKDCIMWIYGSGFPKATDISKQLDKGIDREVIGKSNNHISETNNINSTNTQTYSEYGNNKDVTAPATPEAELWNGWKSHGLKPAYEPILVCMKPNDGTYAENALKHGVSGLNIDGARIPLNGENPPSGSAKRIFVNNQYAADAKYGDNKQTPAQGRFPANIILSCFCEDQDNHNEDCPIKMLDDQSGQLTSGSKNGTYDGWGRGRDIYGDVKPYQHHSVASSGGASRFFYCAKASKAERNRGCEDVEVKQTTGGGGMNNTQDDVCGKYGSINASGHNHHPTVKPLKLMEYLCTLTKTPTGGIVFDPFMGSGTTGIACKNTGREFIGCEMDKDYFEIAEKRLSV